LAALRTLSVRKDAFSVVPAFRHDVVERPGILNANAAWHRHPFSYATPALSRIDA